MRLLLSIFAVTQALTSNWNWYESQIYFHYNGGAKDMLVDLFTDFGYPDEFINLFENATDDSIMGTISNFNDATKESFETEIEVGNSLYTFYSQILSGMTLIQMSRQDLEANAVSQFLIDQVAESGSDLSIMATLVADYFDTTVQAAQDYYLVGTDDVPNDKEGKLQTIVPLLANVKSAIKKYSKDVGLSISTGAMLGNYGRIWGPIIESSLWIWENHYDQMEVWESVYWSYVNFVDNVAMGPLIGICEKSFGPFEAIRQMLLEFDSVLGKTRTLLAYEDENTDLLSIIFFGERGHKGYDITAALDYYFFDYFTELDTLGGHIEGTLSIHSMLFDALVQDWFYDMIKGPVCGVE